jgi:Skp family chaperone for outer membrane proteins
LERIDTNFERILELGTAQRTQKERGRVMDSIQRDIEKINKDIYAAE